jgi:hypothetical protein
MRDTKEEFRKKQIEIILSKTESERAMMGVDMIDAVYCIVKNSILEKQPNLNDREVIAAIFKRYYSNDFAAEELELISRRIEREV